MAPTLKLYTTERTYRQSICHYHWHANVYL